MTGGYALLADLCIRAFRIALLACGGYLVVEVVAERIKKYLKHIYPDELHLELISRFFSYTMLFLISMAISHELGLNIAAFLGAAGVVGIAVGYAAQTSMANIISGLFLMVERPFELGDLLVVNDSEGCVVAVNLFAVTLKTSSHTLVRIPHEQLLKNSFINLTRLPTRRYNFCITVESGADVTVVIKIIENVIASNAWCAHAQKPRIELIRVYGYTYTLAIGVWSTQAHMSEVKKQIPLELKAACERDGIMLSALYREHDKGNI